MVMWLEVFEKHLEMREAFVGRLTCSCSQQELEVALVLLLGWDLLRLGIGGVKYYFAPTSR